jgi:mono/diheme cytochrome c family protein
MFMIKVLKWIGIGLGALLVLVLLAAVSLSFMGNARLNKTLDLQPEILTIHNDETVLARGEHLVHVACQGCHGKDLSGQVVLDDPAIGTIYSANITGFGERRTEGEMVLAIRHGVGHDGRQLIIMPAETFINLSAGDLSAIIAYLETVPKVDKQVPEPKLTFMGRILLAAGMFGQVFPAEYIDHDQPFPAMPVLGANQEYGAYLAGFCKSCHGENLAGGKTPDPESPLAPNLTPGGGLSGWSEADFIQTIRTGVNPHGHKLDPLYMPWESFAKLHDEELKAIWLYLQSLPATATVIE